MPSVARSWGATAGELAQRYPCEDVDVPDGENFLRALDIAAPPEVVFRWLCQLKVAPYSYDLVDNLGRRSPRALTPGVERLEIGQRVMTIFTLHSFVPDRHLTLVLRRGSSRLFGPLVMSYVVHPMGTGTRLVAVLRMGRVGVLGGLRREALAWGDLVMMRKQLRTVRELAEAPPAG